MAETDTEERRSRIDWPATFAGAAAAVTVAVLLSTLGAAGTLIGAALGSVIATVSSALYKQGIESSRRRMAEVQAAALQRVNLADQNVRRAARRSDPEAAERELDRTHRHLDAAGEELAEEPAAAESPERSRWADLQWKRIAVLAAVVFMLSLLAISAVELVAGKSVSTITGGTDGSDRTSLTGVFGKGGKGKDEQRKQPPAEETPTPTPTPTPDPTPTETPTGPVPSGPTAPATPSDTPSVTPTPSDTATPTPTPTPTPSQGASP
jgi:hypothetical protein